MYHNSDFLLWAAMILCEALGWVPHRGSGYRCSAPWASLSPVMSRHLSLQMDLLHQTLFTLQEEIDDQEEMCYPNGLILQLGFSPSLLKHFLISKWASASLFRISGFWVLVFELFGSPSLTRPKQRWKEDTFSFYERFRSHLLYKALWGVIAWLCFRRELKQTGLEFQMGPLDSAIMLAVITEETRRGMKARWVSSPGKLMKLVWFLCCEIGISWGWKMIEVKGHSNF